MYRFYQVTFTEYSNATYKLDLTFNQDNTPTAEEVMDLLEEQESQYFNDLDNMVGSGVVVKVTDNVQESYWMLEEIETTTTRLNKIRAIKADIKDAIEEMGVEMTNILFADYADKIKEIITESEPVEAPITELFCPLNYITDTQFGSGYVNQLNTSNLNSIKADIYNYNFATNQYTQIPQEAGTWSLEDITKQTFAGVYITHFNLRFRYNSINYENLFYRATNDNGFSDKLILFDGGTAAGGSNSAIIYTNGTKEVGLIPEYNSPRGLSLYNPENKGDLGNYIVKLKDQDMRD